MITLTPAYGRDYKTAKAVKEAYLTQGKDFLIADITSRWDGKPVNQAQLGDEQVKIRFANLRKVTVIGESR